MQVIVSRHLYFENSCTCLCSYSFLNYFKKNREQNDPMQVDKNSIKLTQQNRQCLDKCLYVEAKLDMSI